MAEADRAVPILDAFRRSPAAVGPAHVPLVIRLRTVVLDGPDTFDLVAAHIADHRLAFVAELRDFEGILGGNVQHYAVIEARLDPLPAGRYDVELTIRTLSFTKHDHPETATYRSEASRMTSFAIAERSEGEH